MIGMRVVFFSLRKCVWFFAVAVFVADIIIVIILFKMFINLYFCFSSGNQ